MLGEQSQLELVTPGDEPEVRTHWETETIEDGFMLWAGSHADLVPEQHAAAKSGGGAVEQ